VSLPAGRHSEQSECPITPRSSRPSHWGSQCERRHSQRRVLTDGDTGPLQTGPTKQHETRLQPTCSAFRAVSPSPHAGCHRLRHVAVR
jgi:hypothetical protein